MQATVVPLLARQRALYDLPRGMDRFRAYVEVLRNGGDTLVPLSAMNPMGRERATAAFDALLVLRAEEVAQAACAEAMERLPEDARLRVGLSVADDAQGGWTERWQTELQALRHEAGPATRDWAVVLHWSSEAPTAALVRERVLAAIYRNLHQRRHGPPRTVGELLVQEGRSRAFAGARPDAAPADPRTVLPHAGAQDVGACIGVLYGDPAARALGYPELGIPPDGGLALAIRQARAGPDPASLV